jgi:hypothetical protein
MSTAFKRWLAERLSHWAGRLQASADTAPDQRGRSAAPADEPPARPPSRPPVHSTGGPPAHWLALVSRHAPQLLAPSTHAGRGVRADTPGGDTPEPPATAPIEAPADPGAAAPRAPSTGADRQARSVAERPGTGRASPNRSYASAVQSTAERAPNQGPAPVYGPGYWQGYWPGYGAGPVGSRARKPAVAGSSVERSREGMDDATPASPGPNTPATGYVPSSRQSAAVDGTSAPADPDAGAAMPPAGHTGRPPLTGPTSGHRRSNAAPLHRSDSAGPERGPAPTRAKPLVSASEVRPVAEDAGRSDPGRPGSDGAKPGSRSAPVTTPPHPTATTATRSENAGPAAKAVLSRPATLAFDDISTPRRPGHAPTPLTPSSPSSWAQPSRGPLGWELLAALDRQASSSSTADAASLPSRAGHAPPERRQPREPSPRWPSLDRADGPLTMPAGHWPSLPPTDAMAYAPGPDTGMGTEWLAAWSAERQSQRRRRVDREQQGGTWNG